MGERKWRRSPPPSNKNFGYGLEGYRVEHEF